jgi:Tfp pilus assembly protein PilF
MKRQDVAQAEALCRKAHQADPKQADYLALLAWIESQKPDNQSGPATLARIGMLDTAVTLNEKCERAYYYRAMLHKRLANERDAFRDFKKASDLNPRNLDAVREVRLANMRSTGKIQAAAPSDAAPPSKRGGRPSQRPPEGGGGLFGKLFRK